MAGGIKVQIDFDGLQKPRAGLAKLRDLGEDITPFMEDATAIVLKSTINRFRTGRGPEGIPWPQTKRQVRQAVGSTGPNKARILDDTGGLLSSIQGETTSNSAEVGSKGSTFPASWRTNSAREDKRAFAGITGSSGKPSASNSRACPRLCPRLSADREPTRPPLHRYRQPRRDGYRRGMASSNYKDVR